MGSNQRRCTNIQKKRRSDIPLIVERLHLNEGVEDRWDREGDSTVIAGEWVATRKIKRAHRDDLLPVRGV